MIEIVVVSRQGAAPGSAAFARFGPEGGSIGRADTNTLVLDDPDRTVSRVHAQIICRAGAYAIIDRGSNPLQLNGRPIGAGNEAPLGHGDRLLIGGFELAVSLPQGALSAPADSLPEPQATEDDPFSHLLDGLVAPPGNPSPLSTAAQVKPDPTAGLFPDPLSEGLPAPASADPFADLLRAPAARTGREAAASRPDDFSDLVTPSPASKAESIDSLFGLGEPTANDPLAMTPLDDPLAQPNMASAVDPLASLARAATPGPTARSDHLPVDEFAFAAPVARIPASANMPSEAVVPAAAESQQHMVPSSAPAAPPPEARVVPIGSGARPTLPSLDTAVPPVEPEWVPVSPEFKPAASPPRSAPVAPLAAGDATADEALLAAFLRGLGPVQQAPGLLTPGLMERIGDLLRTSTEGTLQLLHTRQQFKHEVRAQVTVIAAQANNPLKFSPTVEVALAHLLGPGMRGFMPAEAAMRDAYQDLRAHEFGVMVGMRAALAHVIEQFAPEALEQNIAAKSRLDAIFSANRKAKLWDQFVKLYADIAREAEDDFHALFGKAFLKAYEEQLDRLQRDGKKQD